MQKVDCFQLKLFLFRLSTSSLEIQDTRLLHLLLVQPFESFCWRMALSNVPAPCNGRSGRCFHGETSSVRFHSPWRDQALDVRENKQNDLSSQAKKTDVYCGKIETELRNEAITVLGIFVFWWIGHCLDLASQKTEAIPKSSAGILTTIRRIPSPSKKAG